MNMVRRFSDRVSNWVFDGILMASLVLAISVSVPASAQDTDPQGSETARPEERPPRPPVSRVP